LVVLHPCQGPNWPAHQASCLIRLELQLIEASITVGISNKLIFKLPYYYFGGGKHYGLSKMSTSAFVRLSNRDTVLIKPPSVRYIMSSMRPTLLTIHI